jgi:hypothetical protein
MIKITDTEVFGFRAALRDMRNPMESWDRSDSQFVFFTDVQYPWPPGMYVPEHPIIGPGDMALAKKLIAGGTEHRKFLRQIVINAVFEAPRYAWQEIDTYKVATVRNSCSTMHKLGHRELTPDDFAERDILPSLLEELNSLGRRYRDGGKEDYQLVVRMKRLLPEGFLQRAGYHMSYETALAMFRHRANHRLAEWGFTGKLETGKASGDIRCQSYSDNQHVAGQEPHVIVLGEASRGYQAGKISICDWIYLLPYMPDFISAVKKET